MEVSDRIRRFAKQLGERLWVKPLVLCVVSIGAVFLAKTVDRMGFGENLPSIAIASVEALLSNMAASMLVIATFAVATMVSAYASASSSATPRAFALVIADDKSQNALSTFVGAFIFSIVGLVAVKNEYFNVAGRAALFALTVFVFAIVIFTFVRWIDHIARLGRVGNSIERVEDAAHAAFKRRRAAPALGGVPAIHQTATGRPVFAPTVGYVQEVDTEALQSLAEKFEGRITVVALPGMFVGPGEPVAYVLGVDAEDDKVASAFLIGRDRRFADDPRFGLAVLSEIAARALSPGVNDPGTAIDIIGSFVRLFTLWAEPQEEPPEHKFDRVEVPELSVRDMFDDAFTSIARDGAASIEVALRLQKALKSLSTLDHLEIQDAAKHHSRLALARAKKSMDLPEDLSLVQEVAALVGNPEPHTNR